jgi:uncharacterized membrane protein YqaE (UPF0057 family)
VIACARPGTQLAGTKERPMELVKILCAIFIPPVAAYLQVGISTHFWINIVLTLLGGLPGMIHALWLVFSNQTA